MHFNCNIAISGDPYVNVTINSVVEIFAALSVYLAYRCGRRPMLAASYIFAGTCCLVAMFFNSNANGKNGMLISKLIT